MKINSTRRFFAVLADTRMYKNPFFNAMMTYIEILPAGLIVTLISSLILKRKAEKEYGRKKCH
jgi:hypothetical protein